MGYMGNASEIPNVGDLRFGIHSATETEHVLQQHFLEVQENDFTDPVLLIDPLR